MGAQRPRLVLRLQLPARAVGGEAWPSCVRVHPQRVPRLPVCRIPCLGSVLHARTRVHQSLARARCPIVCTRLSRRPSAAPPALQ